MTLGSLIPSSLQTTSGRCQTDVFTYDAANPIQVWTKPPRAKSMLVYCTGAGGGGGAGVWTATAIQRNGGGGGGGGATYWRFLSAANTPSQLYVIVGAGGTGPVGTGAPAGGTQALSGTAGGNTTVSQDPINPPTKNLLVMAGGGGGGKGGTVNIGVVGGGGGGSQGQGTTGTGTTSVAGGAPSRGVALLYAISGQGARGSTNLDYAGCSEYGGGGGGGCRNDGATRSHGGSSMFGGGGGGLGGFLNSANGAADPRSGGASGIYVDGSIDQSSRGGGTWGAGNGGNGPDASTLYGAGGGGGGGRANVGVGYNGGNGGFPGGGGGGGGAGTTAGGTGGQGAHGRVIIVTYF